MPPESAEVLISPEAERDLESIWLYTLEEWGFEQANRYSDVMMDEMSKLAKRPKSGVACITSERTTVAAAMVAMLSIIASNLTALPL